MNVLFGTVVPKYLLYCILEVVLAIVCYEIAMDSYLACDTWTWLLRMSFS
jgi:hypothetical protein